MQFYSQFYLCIYPNYAYSYDLYLMAFKKSVKNYFFGLLNSLSKYYNFEATQLSEKYRITFFYEEGQGMQ